jgi:hypothetical protein
MNSEELSAELHKLNAIDKLRAMEVLVVDPATKEQAQLIPGKEYEVWSPYDSAGAAETLTKILDRKSALCAF